MNLTWSRDTVTDELVLALLNEVVRESRERSLRMTAAVVDESGVLKGFVRMDGCRLAPVQVAQDKAFTAVSGRPTHLWHTTVENDAVMKAGAHHGIDRLVTLGGGFPLLHGDQIVGGLGVSGGHYTEDMAVAQAALAAVGLKSEW